MSDPRIPFVIGVTGKMALPGYDPAVSRRKDLEPAVRAIYDRVWDVLDWVFGEDARRSDPERAEVAGLPEPLGLVDTPVVVLSSLAPGADTIVAEAALDYAMEMDRDVTVRAPLPFPADLYPRASTFAGKGTGAADEAAVRRYRRLLVRIRCAAKKRGERASDVFCVRLHPSIEGDPIADLADTPVARERRKLRYRAAGEWVATASHLLLAVQDREADAEDVGIYRDRGACGADAIVQVKRKGPTFRLMGGASTFSWSDNGPVLRIPFDAAKGPSAPCLAPFEWFFAYDSEPKSRARTSRARRALEALGLLLPEAPRPKVEAVPSRDLRGWKEQGIGLLRRMAKHLDGFNALPVHPAEAALATWSPVTPPPRPPGVVDDSFRAFSGLLDRWRRMERILKRASRRAGELQGKRHRLLWSLLWLILIAASCLGAYEHWEPELDSGASAGGGHGGDGIVRVFEASLLFTTLFTLGWIALRFRAYSASGAERERFDLRALAEGLRVQLAWSMAGLDRSVGAHYMQRQRGELDWIRFAIQNVAAPTEASAAAFTRLDPARRSALLTSVRERWVEGQLAYYRKNAASREGRERRCHQWGWSLLGAGLLNIVAKFLSAVSPSLHHVLEAQAAFISLALFGIGAVIIFVGIRGLHGEIHGDHVDPGGHHPVDPARGLFHWLFARPFLWGVAFIAAIVPYGLPALITHIVRSVDPHLCDCLRQVLAALPAAHNWWLILTGIILLVGALCLAWAERNQFAEEARTYRTMEGLFDCADRRLRELIDGLGKTHDPAVVDEIHDILFELGREALAEHAEWLQRRRIHPLEPFMAG